MSVQVAERALFLWNNEHLVTVGVLSMQYPNSLLPVIYGPLTDRSTRHWNTTVEGLAHNVLRMYNEQDATTFERCAAALYLDVVCAEAVPMGNICGRVWLLFFPQGFRHISMYFV